MFNTLKYVKILQEAGVPREQAETQIQIMTEMMESTLATKQDLKEESQALRHEVALLRQEVKQDLELFRREFQNQLIQSEQRMTIRLGTIFSVGLGIAVTLAKLFA